MAIMHTPQRIELVFDGKPHWFNVWRYTTPQELYTAMLTDGIRVDNEKLTAYTEVYPEVVGGKANDECGRMYLLDTSIATYAREATHMALGILARDGLSSIHPTVGPAVEDQQDLASIVGTITSQLYMQSKYY
jgi:hypothetical protein